MHAARAKWPAAVNPSVLPLIDPNVPANGDARVQREGKKGKGEKSQGVGFDRFETGYHLVPFNCVHRSLKHLSNSLANLNS